jgi:16S rRNA (guanine966-N2)-methyltransferase
MRIVAGRFRGLKLETPGTQSIRPTSDRVREALFSILMHRIPGAHVLDLFAGTGALGLEALSRGAAQAVFVDQGAEAVRIIRANIMKLRVSEQTQVFRGEVKQIISRLAQRKCVFDLIFLDPPYGKGHIETTLSPLASLTRPDTLLVAEHSVKERLPPNPAHWHSIETRSYGNTAISFYAIESSHLPISS